MMSNKIAHMGFVQAVITRMAANSFMIKGWMVTLTAAIFALTAKDADQQVFSLAYVVIIIFWILDAYYFSLECKFRSLFEVIRKKEEGAIDFAMDIGSFKENIFLNMFNISQWPIYIFTVLAVCALKSLSN